ncbi:MAG: SdrD B-like domain-containing protein, partial [Actinomycetota bacterium]
ADLEQVFGYTGAGSIGDALWLDVEADGTRDLGEAGLPGALVTLTWAGEDGVFGTADDVVFPTQTTAPDGNYLFENLPAGEFQVDVAGTPAGLFPTADPDGGSDDTSQLTLSPGEVDLDQDFGYVGRVIDGVSAGVGDTIFIDLDGDGVQDVGEPGVEGVTVTVVTAGVDGVLGTADDITITTETDENGQYLVTGLPSGPTSVTYDVDDLPDGYVPDSDLDGGDLVTATVDLGEGETRLDVDFGIVGDATITGTVWTDLDADGVIDAGEAGIPGVQVEVTWAGPAGPVTIIVTTDDQGRWSLDDIPPGDWTTQVVLATVPPELVPTTPTDGSVTIPLGGTGNVDNGFVPGGTIGDTVFDDPNRNGTQDPGENGVPGVVVILIDGDGNEVERTTTGPDGTYEFDDLPPDDYIVRVEQPTLPEGVMVIVDTADPVANGETPVSLGPGEDRDDIDFGVAMPPLPTTGTGVTLLLIVGTILLTVGLVLWSARRRPVVSVSSH